MKSKSQLLEILFLASPGVPAEQALAEMIVVAAGAWFIFPLDPLTEFVRQSFSGDARRMHAALAAHAASQFVRTPRHLGQ